MTEVSYDRIGTSYSTTRRADPRLEQAIWGALGGARTVLNIGAGAGSYEPPHCEVVAVEPSEVMIAQRPAGAAPVIRARAEALPFADDSFDAAMAVLSDHHWGDRPQGFREMTRVARERLVLFTFNPGEIDLFWLTQQYLTGFASLAPAGMTAPGAWEADLRRQLTGSVRLIPFPIPRDCRDGFLGAFWARPHAYLDPSIRAGISVFAQLPAAEVESAIEALATDLESGRWEAEHRDLHARAELHLGYYVLAVDLIRRDARAAKGP